MNRCKTWSANFLLKGMAVLVLYALLAHPSVYLTFWDRRLWYPIVLGIFVVPLLLVWSVKVFFWRVKISSSAIEIWSLRGVLKRQLAEVAYVERAWGNVLVAFKDGSQRTIPSLVGDLDGIVKEIASRRA